MNEVPAAILEAEKAGFDLSLVDSNLELTPEQRALRHDSALELALAFRAAGAKARANDAQAAPSSTTTR